MKNYILLLLVGLSNCLFAQEVVETEISSRNTYKLSIIQVFPDSFPQVSVVFQAKNELGAPLWLLTPDDFTVEENNVLCEIIRVINISENKPLNLALVFDHSSSMSERPIIIPDTLKTMNDTISFYENYTYDPNEKKPIDFAKAAIIDFFASKTLHEDSLFLVGFSGKVDAVPPLSNDFAKFERMVNRTKANGSTAFYDAVYTAIDSLVLHSSQPAVIALTDGGDNSSEHTYRELIDHAKDQEVPIFIIGLGNVNSNLLDRISVETKGFYYHTNDATQLSQIYANIKKQLRSVYQLDYVSNEDNSTDQFRELQFSFINDSLTFENGTADFELPKEVVAHLEERFAQMETRRLEELERLKLEEEQLAEEAEKQQQIYLAIGGAGVLVLGIAAFIVFARRKEKKKLKITKLYPNPFTSQITIDYQTPVEGDFILKVRNTSGMLVHEEKVVTGISQLTIDLSSRSKGIYVFQLEGEQEVSVTIRAVKI